MLFAVIKRAAQDIFTLMTQFLLDRTGLTPDTVTFLLVGALSLLLLKFFLGPKKRTASNPKTL